MATPGRTTRARSRANTPAPLPAVVTRQSHAYGSKGKADLKHQVVRQNTNFAEAFTTGRDQDAATSVAEESEEELSSEQPGTRNGTVVDSVARYEPSFSATTMPPPPRTARMVAPRAVAPTAEMRDEIEAEPWSITVLLMAIPRYLGRNLGAILLGGLVIIIFTVMPLGGSLEQRRDEMVRGVKIAAGLPGYDQPPAYLEATWNFLRYNHTLVWEGLPQANVPELQWAINVNTISRIQNLENTTAALQANVTDLQEYLPQRMVVDVVDGRMAVKEEFWEALLERMAGSDVLYDRFLAATEQRASEMASSAAADHVEGAIRSERILGREAALELVAENNHEMYERFSELLKDTTQDTLRDVRGIAASIARETVENTPSDYQLQLALMAKSNLLRNTLDALQKVNYFSPNLGAMIDPHNTSPGQAKKQNFLARLWTGATNSGSRGPAYALTKWDEMGDCWCAAESADKGKAQLAVLLSQKISPEHLLIDHIPARGTLGIAAAPREFELWAEADTVEEAELFREKIAEAYYYYSIEPCMTANSPPSESAVCIGEGSYDIHGDNWVQTFQPFVDMREVGLTTTKIFFRVKSNWGAGHTCIYRLRLTGHADEGMDAEEISGF